MIVKNQTRSTLVFMAPALILIGIFYLVPAFIAFLYSFTNKSFVGYLAKNYEFVGLENYHSMFLDGDFYTSILNTIVFLFGSAIIGQQVLGFTIAYLMQKASKNLRKIVGVCVLLGWVVPEVVVSVIFFTFLNTEGSLNDVLGWFRIKPTPWLFNKAMLSIIVANIWRGTAFSMLMFDSALKAVPVDIQEAARMDGASKWQNLLFIILPIIKGSILTNTILITLGTLGLFGLIYALTGGGPGLETTTLPIYMYNQAFVSYQIGYGTAMAVVLLLLGTFLSLFYIKSLRHRL